MEHAHIRNTIEADTDPVDFFTELKKGPVSASEMSRIFDYIWHKYERTEEGLKKIDTFLRRIEPATFFKILFLENKDQLQSLDETAPWFVRKMKKVFVDVCLSLMSTNKELTPIVHFLHSKNAREQVFLLTDLKKIFEDILNESRAFEYSRKKVILQAFIDTLYDQSNYALVSILQKDLLLSTYGRPRSDKPEQPTEFENIVKEKHTQSEKLFHTCNIQPLDNSAYFHHDKESYFQIDPTTIGILENGKIPSYVSNENNKDLSEERRNTSDLHYALNIISWLRSVSENEYPYIDPENKREKSVSFAFITKRLIGILKSHTLTPDPTTEEGLFLHQINSVCQEILDYSEKIEYVDKIDSEQDKDMDIKSRFLIENRFKLMDLVENLCLHEKETIETENPPLYQKPIRELILSSHINPYQKEESKEDTLFLADYILNPEVHAYFKKTLNINLNEIPLRSQIHFLRFLAKQEKVFLQRLTDALHKHEDQETNILSTFLACAENEAFGEKILALIKNLQTSDLIKILNKYHEIVTITQNMDLVVKGILPDEDVTVDAVDTIVQNVLSRANKILTTSFNAIEVTDLDKIITDIESLRADILFLTSIFKTVGNKETLQTVAHSQFQTMIPAQDIDEETRAQMIAMYAKNHENESGAEALIEKFKAGFENTDRRLYTFSYKGTLISFIAFDAKGDRPTYASAFNVAPDARGYKIGEAMMDQALNEQAKENALAADCVATLPISAKYIESGFLGTHFYMDGTDPILDIVRNDSILQTLTTRSLSPQEILTQTLMRPIQKNIEMYAAASQNEISFEPLSRGFVLTRYLVDKNTGRAHVVFEKPTVNITQWSEPQQILDRKAA